MRKLKLTITSLLTTISMLLVSARSAYAQTGIGNLSKYKSIEEVVIALLSLLQPIVVFAFVGMIIYGGWLYLTSQGNDDKIKQAKQVITAAIVGFIIIVLAPALVRLIASILGVDPNLLRVS